MSLKNKWIISTSWSLLLAAQYRFAKMKMMFDIQYNWLNKNTQHNTEIDLNLLYKGILIIIMQ